MNSKGYKSKIKLNDTVILSDQDGLQSITVQPGESVQSRNGVFLHSDMLGKEYGSKMWSNKGKTYRWALHPTPELWTLSLPHRTQILYTPNISLITSLLELIPGTSVCESGTGSGSLSHAIARTIAPTGHLYTYDFHAERVQQANDEFTAHGLSELVTCQCRDVCREGFNVENYVTAIFLDLPNPWEVIPHCPKSFSPGYSRIVSFSPCVEQIQKSCIALRESGFIDIQMHECLSQQLQVSSCRITEARLDESTDKREERHVLSVVPRLCMPSHTGYLLSASYIKCNVHDL
ncbi:tRNA (adenine(58)-N(1))-methyltransferase catalytic subunit TRMT61A-like [Oopsacas minuta]|uniref:tRNA (adenine(58)-N(1))-methyltransferase catalytic subunit TRMT61A n=1 Tax=Oopsacas minuta TaxID=111878 RepID=A0AAV7KAH3_9METZ|nr:tRNA (adenine(58)-N(1))-methyltransferase catalytic subunit TRMT61A-like [Oopsacas minuta]